METRSPPCGNIGPQNDSNLTVATCMSRFEVLRGQFGSTEDARSFCTLIFTRSLSTDEHA